MYSKTQRKVIIGYLVFLAIALWLKHHGEIVKSSSPMDLILGAPVPFLFGVFAIQNGWISTRYSTPLDREKAPVSFWFCVGLALLLGAGMFFWGLSEVFQSGR